MGVGLKQEVGKQIKRLLPLLGQQKTIVWVTVVAMEREVVILEIYLRSTNDMTC